MSRYLIGLVLIAIAIVLIVKTDWFLSFFGRIAWAEEHLGFEGGTRIFYKLIGFGLIILAFLVMSGKVFSILDWLFVRRTG
ncbi:MAG: hypothetical protein HYV33_02790 [Candidatus Kerfeldbacteria bacterium]|nr:hypothetical protein [Candidatus Kerfeldbacteria bacterium]